ncbi:Multicopper oxidase, N-terminal [Dillenia turbinata]|uniref:Multicopper oxidase, N-terminal n=1 Tax=Dillenia turbinata TaxID=194707 RepID=A0AAN8ZI72_9MAGN
MASCKLMFLCLVHISLFLSSCFADDPYVYYNFEVSYITASPLGVPQQVIAINGKFPGPTINVTTNNNVVVNVRNKLDEDLLISWAGIQQRRSSWQDGVKDQIGSFFYFPSTLFQRAAGGYGGFIINNRPIIPIPFATPDGDIVILIGDWYKKNHTDLRKTLNGGKDLGMPDGVLINGKGPYRYNDTLVPEGIDYETINIHPGKTYRIRVHNVGISTSLNFRIQNHNLLLAETEGSYTVQQNYTNLDIHGSFRYGSINVTQVYVLKNKPPVTINGKRRTTLNGISFVNPDTPIKLADAYNLKGVYKLDFPTKPLTGDPKIETSVINGTYRGFMEIVLQNNDTKVQTFHLNGYAFFVVGYDLLYPCALLFNTYFTFIDTNCVLDIKVFHNLTAAWIMGSGQKIAGAHTTSGMVLLVPQRRTENLDSWHLGQETYIRVVNPENTNKTELPVPDNALYCGALSKMQKVQDISSAASEKSKLLFTLLMMIIVTVSILR